MNGHQLHRLSFFRLVHVGKQRRMVKVVAQRYLLPGFSRKVIDCLLQLRQIVKPLFFPAGTEHIFITALM